MDGPGGNQGGFGGNQGGFGGNQGGFGGNQGGFGGNQGGFGGNQGGFGGNQGGFGGNQGGFGGNQQNFGQVGNQGGMGYYDNSNKSHYNSNPYEGLSKVNDGPTYYSPSNLTPQQGQEGPKKFGTFDSVLDNSGNRESVNPIYPSVNPNSY